MTTLGTSQQAQHNKHNNNEGPLLKLRCPRLPLFSGSGPHAGPGPVQLERKWVKAAKAKLPERPLDKQCRYQKELSLPYTLTAVFCTNPELSAIFETALRTRNSPKQIANYIIHHCRCAK